MQISHALKETILGKSISLDVLTKRDAFQMITDINLTGDYGKRLGISDLKTEADFKRWGGFDNSSSVSVRELFDRNINPHLLLWVMLNEDIIPDNILHLLSHEYCTDLLVRLAEQSAFIDFRFKRILDTKLKWIINEASLGNLRAVQSKAKEIYMDSFESGDPKIIAAAQAVYSCVMDKPISSISGVFKAAERVYDFKDESQRRFKILRENLLS